MLTSLSFRSNTLSLPHVSLSENEKEKGQHVSTVIGYHSFETNAMSESKVCLYVEKQVDKEVVLALDAASLAATKGFGVWATFCMHA